MHDCSNRKPLDTMVRAPRKEQPYAGLLGEDAAMVRIRRLIDQAAASDATVLITGETGTGKEIVARALHAHSHRADRPFVAINCGAISANLQESELFGHTAGAFTGATNRKRGIFETADGGSVFLDEVGETATDLQIKLLRTLQSGEYSLVGSAQTNSCNVRVIAATNRDLHDAVRAGAFRADLYYRLNVIAVHLPPLRERRCDIPMLARHFLRQYAHAYAVDEPRLEPAFERFLASYEFPGNVRELENLVHRAVVLGRTEVCERTVGLPPLHHNERISDDAEFSIFSKAKEQVIERFERDYLTRVLRECGGIVRRAAHRSGLSERNFHEKLKRYEIDGKLFRA